MIPPPPIDPHTHSLIRMAVCEDLGDAGDRTVQLSIPEHHRSAATIVTRKPGIISGTFLLAAILAEYQTPDNPVACTLLTPDGSRAVMDQPIAHLVGSTRVILSAERVLLNFLSHLSGIATLTRCYVAAVSHLPHPPQICDTRKTTPAFRRLDKYAVMCGGGTNHRLGLYDGVMLKDNHLAALRNQLGKEMTLAQLTAHIRSQLPSHIALWLEVDTLTQLRDALSGGGAKGADIILLDNFTPDQMRQAVVLRNQFHPTLPQLEASGGITLDNIAEVAATGVERISIGALTHSAPILDLSLELSSDLSGDRA